LNSAKPKIVTIFLTNEQSIGGKSKCIWLKQLLQDVKFWEGYMGNDGFPMLA
jgi:hypothetical protein